MTMCVADHEDELPIVAALPRGSALVEHHALGTGETLGDHRAERVLRLAGGDVRVRAKLDHQRVHIEEDVSVELERATRNGPSRLAVDGSDELRRSPRARARH